MNRPVAATMALCANLCPAPLAAQESTPDETAIVPAAPADVPPPSTWVPAPSPPRPATRPWATLPPFDQTNSQPPRWYTEATTSRSDPRAATGALLLASGALIFGGGAAVLADLEPDSFSAPCAPGGGCVSDRGSISAHEESPVVALIAGGIATSLFGGALLAHSLGDGVPLPAKSNRRLTAGMMLTGFGLGTTVAASTLVIHDALTASESSLVGAAMFVPAAGLIATGVPLWITGSRPPPEQRGWKEVEEDNRASRDVLRSPTMGSIGLGMAVLGIGIAGAGIAAAAAGDEPLNQTPANGDFIDFRRSSAPESHETILATATAGAALVSLGVPMAIIGLGTTTPSEAHASAPPLATPDIAFGLGTANVTWRY